MISGAIFSPCRTWRYTLTRDGIPFGRGLDVYGRLRRAAAAVLDIRCLGITKAGRPRHPLYLRKDIEPVPFNPLSGSLRR